MKAKDEVALIGPMGMLNDVEISSIENLVGDFFERNEPLGLQPIVLMLVPEEVHFVRKYLTVYTLSIWSIIPLALYKCR